MLYYTTTTFWQSHMIKWLIPRHIWGVQSLTNMTKICRSKQHFMQRRNSVSPPDLITDLNSQPFISRNKESVSHHVTFEGSIAYCLKFTRMLAHWLNSPGWNNISCSFSSSNNWDIFVNSLLTWRQVGVVTRISREQGYLFRGIAQ